MIINSLINSLINSIIILKVVSVAFLRKYQTHNMSVSSGSNAKSLIKWITPWNP